ncbi:MAG: hypothetical protein EOP51_21620 [Sphingobacteriales bacterium]|nr:MAG: hypothetical protein EOP51_21620 [Sphingobacteriales bacterium]
MKYILPLVILLVIGTSACKNKAAAISRSQMKAKTDSLVGVKMQEVTAQAMEDLDRRMSIEVKAKTDSLVAICMGTADTTAKLQ